MHIVWPLQGDALSGSWHSAGAQPGEMRSISAQAALQTDDGASGWGHVFSRKSHPLHSGSRDSPGSTFDSPQFSAWLDKANSGGGSSRTSAARTSSGTLLAGSSSGYYIDGTATITELKLYHNSDGQPALLGRGGFGQACRLSSPPYLHTCGSLK